MDASEITRPRWKNCAEASNIHITLDLHIGSNAMVMGDDSELREVLVNRLNSGEVDEDVLHQVVALLDETAQKIERL